MSDPIKELEAVLREVGAVPTFDRERNVTHPCIRCSTTDPPRELTNIGVYTRCMSGNLRPGDAIERPMCAACVSDTRPLRRTNRPGEFLIGIRVQATHPSAHVGRYGFVVGYGREPGSLRILRDHTSTPIREDASCWDPAPGAFNPGDIDPSWRPWVMWHNSTLDYSDHR